MLPVHVIFSVAPEINLALTKKKPSRFSANYCLYTFVRTRPLSGGRDNATGGATRITVAVVLLHFVEEVGEGRK